MSGKSTPHAAPIADAGLTGILSADATFARLTTAFLSHDQKTPVILAELIDQFPDEALGPLIKGYMLLMLARSELRPAAEEALHEGRRRLGLSNDWQRLNYAEGLSAWLGGNPRGAISAMESIIGQHPMDAMAIKISHATRFMLGDADGMRRSLARVVSVYTEQVANAGFIKGCYAFALEETGAYADAEHMGRRAVELEPTDAWGRHAVAHVYEMTGRAGEGLSWLADSQQWAHCNNFSYHMAWHLALFQLELGQVSEALRHYDTAIRAQKTDDFRDIANASSLLQRIELAGTSVGNRWDELADIAERRINDRQLAFADLHYLLALLGAGRFTGAESLVHGMLAAGGQGHNGRLSADLAAPIAAGLVAFKAGRMAQAVQFLGPARDRMQLIGGSHAQRDVFQQIYLEALVRSGDRDTQAALQQRLAARGGVNRFASQRLERVLQSSGSGQMALDALALTPPLQTH